MESGKGITYEQAGVNVEAGDNLSRTLYEAAKQTWANREGKFGQLDELFKSFSGFRAMPAELLDDTKDIYLGMSDDGIGTKVEIAERTNDHSTMAFDLLAMVCDDAIVRGAEPIAVTTTLDVRSLNDPNIAYKVRDLASGYVEAANAANVVILNGEVAELGDRVGGHGNLNYNWSATVLWAAHQERVLDGTKVRPGDSIVAFHESGFRSNGLSLVRKILSDRFGPDWHEAIKSSGISAPGQDIHLAEFILPSISRPSTIYTGCVNELTGGYDINTQPKAEIHGIAHITGGGIPGKLGRLLEPTDLGATLYDTFPPPNIMDYVRLLGRVDLREAYSTWNMGHGMLIVTPEPDKVLDVAQGHSINAKLVGSITESPGIRINTDGPGGPYLDFE